MVRFMVGGASAASFRHSKREAIARLPSIFLGMAMMKPGGLHVMLMALHGPLKEGEPFMVTLKFKNAGDVTVPVMTMGVAAKGPEGGHGHNHGHGTKTTQ